MNHKSAVATQMAKASYGTKKATSMATVPLASRPTADWTVNSAQRTRVSRRWAHPQLRGFAVIGERSFGIESGIETSEDMIMVRVARFSYTPVHDHADARAAPPDRQSPRR